MGLVSQLSIIIGASTHAVNSCISHYYYEDTLEVPELSFCRVIMLQKNLFCALSIKFFSIIIK